MAVSKLMVVAMKIFLAVAKRKQFCFQKRLLQIARGQMKPERGFRVDCTSLTGSQFILLRLSFV